MLRPPPTCLHGGDTRYDRVTTTTTDTQNRKRVTCRRLNQTQVRRLVVAVIISHVASGTHHTQPHSDSCGRLELGRVTRPFGRPGNRIKLRL